MNKFSLLTVVFSVSILSACVSTSSEDKVDLTTVNFKSLTCEQIDQVFIDYKAKVDSGDTVTGLLSIVSSKATATADKAKAAAMQIYHQAKLKADPIKRAKGC